MTKDEFIEIYDSAPDLAIGEKDLDEQYKVLGIESHLSRSPKEVHDTIKKRIVDLLRADEKAEEYIPSYEIYGKKEVWFYKDAIYNRNDFTNYYIALEQLQHMYGNELRKFVPFKERDRWVEAMTLLKAYMKWNKLSGGSFSRGKEKEKDRVSAIKRLMRLGARVSFAGDDMQISNVEPILRQISDNIEAMGGVKCIEFMLSRIEYDSRFHRFLMPSIGGSLGVERKKPAVPIGYIFNIAFNKIHSPGRKDVRTCIGETVRMATDICTALYSVQSYNLWEDVYIEQRKFEKAFDKWISQDTLYNVPQASPIFVLDWMEFLLTELEKNGEQMSSEYTLGDYRKVMEYLMSMSETKTFCRLSQSAIVNECCVKRDAVLAVLDDIACNALNPGYQHPLDYEKVNAPDYPAFRLPNGDVLLYPASLGAMGWYEVLMSRLRICAGESKRIEHEAGICLEQFLRKVLREHGISSVAGKYHAEGIEGECDAIIQSERKICLLELKKKNLTRRSREGYVYQMLLDFAGAVFNPQVQAFRTEAVLVRDGALRLAERGMKHIVEYKNRRILRMSVSLNDFGPIHEQYILDNVIKTFCSFIFSVNRAEIEAMEPNPDKVLSVVKGYEELAKKQRQLEQYLGILIEKIPDYTRGLFFSSSFFNMEQLYYMASECHGEEDFLSKLDESRMLIIGDGNFWHGEKARREMKRGE